ncbi:hypothetical protein HNV11_03810 [Spirosoma taeanense]|uniref:Uncharacterized protein n=1 Tax=Spirosoma taeanense TaxID=2735870 RepID=A0A6M5Y771_9BACT|nr:hypothetical protein [Spirosoma taeanense]QJW88562.1 hypothetical protein HNV11_03810 [Spirosoma taeanense]
MNRLLRNCLLFSFLYVSFTTVFAQPTSVRGIPAVDSVIVTGRIRNLSARLYREAPTVLISRNNILQASRELVRPAPLNVDGSFRVSLPLIYSQEELYLNYGRISTAFLAAPGTLSIELNADSLFTSAVPFQFGGVNAQVNRQFARYKAFEAAFSDKPDNRKLSDQVSGKNAQDTYNTVLTAYGAAFRQFAVREKPFPLVAQWVNSINRYNAAGFVYEKATYENEKLPTSLNDSLRPPDDRMLTAARASAMNRFAAYATQLLTTAQTNRSANGLTVRTLSSLLLRYGRNLTEAERTRLQSYMENNSARASDLRFFDGLIKRSNDTIQRLVTYETLMQRSRDQFDEASVGYIGAYTLAVALPSLTLDFARLLQDYVQEQIKATALKQSLNELYRLEVKDSARIRAAVQTLNKAGETARSVEVTPGVFITRDAIGSGSAAFDQVINSNRGKVIYVLLTSVLEESGRQAALDAQRLRSIYRSRDFALVYLPLPSSDKETWVEFSVKNNLLGDHLLLTEAQLDDALSRLRSSNEVSATIINRVGKIVKRNAPLPNDTEDLRKVLDKNL